MKRSLRLRVFRSKRFSARGCDFMSSLTDKPTDSRWTSRKLIIALSLEAIWTIWFGVEIHLVIAAHGVEHEAIQMVGKILDSYTWLSGITIGGYFTANVGEWWARR